MPNIPPENIFVGLVVLIICVIIFVVVVFFLALIWGFILMFLRFVGICAPAKPEEYKYEEKPRKRVSKDNVDLKAQSKRNQFDQY